MCLYIVPVWWLLLYATLQDCWSGVVDVFAPWITTLQSTASIGELPDHCKCSYLPPSFMIILAMPIHCILHATCMYKEHNELMSTMMSVFCEIITKYRHSSHVAESIC